MAARTANDGAIRWGFIGTGRVAGQFARGLMAVAGAQRYAVCSKTPEQARAFAEVHGFTVACDDMDSMLADKGLDVVYIAAPPSHHSKLALACIAAGKAVLVEKPFAASLGEAESVVKSARAAGVFCMEAMWTRFLPAYGEVKRLASSGAIGELRMFIADFGAPVAYDPESPFFSPDGGGGALLDRGVYPIAMAIDLFGAPTSVTSRCVKLPTGVDDLVSASLRFPRDRVASISACLCAYGANEAVIMGSRGRIRVHEPMCRPESFEVAIREPERIGLSEPSCEAVVPSFAERVKEVSWVRRMHSAVSAWLPGGLRRHTVPFRANGYCHEAEEVMRCIRAGKTESERMPLDDSLTALRVVDEIRRSWNETQD